MEVEKDTLLEGEERASNASESSDDSAVIEKSPSMQAIKKSFERRVEWLREQGLLSDDDEDSPYMLQNALDRMKVDAGGLSEEQVMEKWHGFDRELVEEMEPLLTSADEEQGYKYHLGGAVILSMVDVVRLLLDRGADAGVVMEGVPLLHAAAKVGSVEIIELLVKKGGNIAAIRENGMTALHEASKKGRYLAVEWLLTHGADIAAVNEEGSTPLHLASEKGRSEAVDVLLKHGADDATVNENGSTALHIAVEEGEREVVELLLNGGADISARNEDGSTPLHLASAEGNYQVVELLLKHGADIAVTEKNGSTPLHAAARYGKHQVVELLLNRGANIDAVDKDGNTALHYAARGYGGLMVALLLLKYGADVAATNKKMLNPLGSAVMEGHYNGDRIEVARLLCDKGSESTLTSEMPLEKRQQGLLACVKHWRECYDLGKDLVAVPLEVVGGGEDAVKTYLDDLEKTSSDKLVYRSKVCVVGPSTWGKTRLVKSLVTGKPVDVEEDNRTIGIDLLSWSFEGTRTDDETVGEESAQVQRHDVTFWDFAGQDVYQVSHALFFSKRMLYFLCIDLTKCAAMLAEAAKVQSGARAEVKTRFCEKFVLRWVRLVLFSHPAAQFKLIGTKRDLVSEQELESVVNEIPTCLITFVDHLTSIPEDTRKSLKEELSEPMLVTSMESAEDIKQAQDSIKSVILSKRTLSIRMPETYTKVLEGITQTRRLAFSSSMSERLDQVITPVSDLEAIRKKAEVPIRNFQEILRILHDLGDILWYKDDTNFKDDSDFKELVILDPTIVLDLVREVVNHTYEGDEFKELHRNGTLPHTLLLKFPMWGALEKTGVERVYQFKWLLQKFNLAYPANNVSWYDEADMIVPAYWNAKKLQGKLLTRQKTKLTESSIDGSYFAKWQYSIPIDISKAVFVNFVVQCYRSNVTSDCSATVFEVKLPGRFGAAISFRPSSKGRKRDDITIEVAAATSELAWKEMQFFILAMETILLKNYPVFGLSVSEPRDKAQQAEGQLKRLVVDINEKPHDLRPVIDSSFSLEQLRETRPWLPPNFGWFIQRVWTKPGKLDEFERDLKRTRQLDVLQKLIITSDDRQCPAIWSLLRTSSSSPLELRVHSDLSGKVAHAPLKFNVSNEYLTSYPKFIKIGASILSIMSTTIPIPLVSAAVAEAIAASDIKAKVDSAVAAKEVIDQAMVMDGKSVSSSEFGTKGVSFLRRLLELNGLNLLDLPGECNLHCAATEKGTYVWVTKEELDDHKDQLTPCRPPHIEPPIESKTAVSMSLSITDAKGIQLTRYKRVYCRWEIWSEAREHRRTGEARYLSTGWESSPTALDFIDTMEHLRQHTVKIWVYQARRFTCCRGDKEIGYGEARIGDHIDEGCTSSKTIWIPVTLAKAMSWMSTPRSQAWSSSGASAMACCFSTSATTSPKKQNPCQT